MRCDELDLFELEQAEAQAHLAACADCAQAAAALQLGCVGLAAGDADAPPAEVAARLRERVLDRAVERAKPGPGPAPEPSADPRVRLRCTWCHGGLPVSEAVYCADCLAPAHEPCYREHGRCPAPGCAGTHVVAPRRLERPAEAPRVLRGQGRWRTALGAVAMGALVGAAALVPARREAPGAAPAPEVAAAPPVSAALGDGGFAAEAPAEAGPVAAPEPLSATAPPSSASTDHPVPAAPVPAAPSPGDPAPADPALRVLFVEGQPRWEYRYLKNALLRRRQVSLQCLLLSADPEFVQEHTPGLAALTGLPRGEALEWYDALILGDLDARDPAVREWLEEVERVVSRGAGLLVIAGEHQDWRETTLEELLPVAPTGTWAEAAGGGLRPVRTPEGLKDPALVLDPARDDAVWEALPPFGGHYPALAAPGAQVLLATPGDAPAPLLATRRAGLGRVAWLGVDEVWRWRAGEGDRWFARLYLNLLAHVAPRPLPPLSLGLGARQGAIEELSVERMLLRAERVRLALTGGRELTLPHGAVLQLAPQPVGRAFEGVWVGLRGGSVLRGALGEAPHGALTIDTRALGRLRIALEEVSWVRFPEGDPVLARTDPEAPRDQVRLRSGGHVEGTIAAITTRGVELVTPDLGAVSYPLEQVGKVQLVELPAQTPVPPERTPVSLRLRDGCRLSGDLTGVDADGLRVTSRWSLDPEQARVGLRIPLTRVVELRLR